MQNSKKKNRYKRDWLKRLEELTDYEDLQFVMYPRDFQLKERFKELSVEFADDIGETPQYYAEETVNMLNFRLGEISRYKYVLIVKLRKELFTMENSLKDNIKSAFSAFTDVVIDSLGYENTLYDSYFDRCKSEISVLENIVLTAGGRPTSAEETFYLNKRQFLRGVPHDIEEEIFNRKVSSINSTIIDPRESKALKMEAEAGDGYIAFTVLDEFLENMADADLFYNLQMLPFPVEVTVKAQREKKATTKASMSFKKQAIKDDINAQYRAGDMIEDDAEISAIMVKDLQEKLKKEEKFIFNWLAVAIVTGRTKDEAHERALLVRRFLKAEETTARIPRADQLYLFYKMLHGEKMEYLDKDWIQKTLQCGLAELCFGMGQELGTNVGWYIGMVDRFGEHLSREDAVKASRMPVLYHPLLANQQIAGSKSRSPHELVTGDTGGGKSFLAKMIFLYSMMMQIKNLYIDPKKEMRKWFDTVTKNKKLALEIPWFTDLVETCKFVTLDASVEENWGLLDPVVFLPRMEAKELLISVVESIYTFDGKDKIEKFFLQCLTQTIEERESGQEVGSAHVIEKLLNHSDEDVRTMGELLNEKIDSSILKLIFSDGSRPTLSLDHRNTIIEIENLDTADADTDISAYTESQRKSNALMCVLAKFCELFGRDKTVKTKIFFDEAWALTASSQGKKQKKSMLRMGRSYDNSFVFISQGVRDAQDDGEEGNFGSHFAFDEPQNRDGILEMMKMDITEANLEMFDDFLQGQCLYKDFYGNVGKLTVDCLFDEWTEALKTIEKSSVALAEEKFA